MQTKKTAPFEVSNNTKQYLLPTISISDVIAIKKTVDVRWPGQTCGAFGLALNFLCYFLCFKTKKVKRTFFKAKNRANHFEQTKERKQSYNINTANTPAGEGSVSIIDIFQLGVDR